MDAKHTLVHPDQGVPYANVSSNEFELPHFILNPSSTVHNPYECFGAPGMIWPRGFPLSAIHDKRISACEVMEDSGKEPPRIGVVQVLANGNPDVDAAYCLTRLPGGFPFSFGQGLSTTPERSPLRGVPAATMAPYNAQVTLRSSVGQFKWCSQPERAYQEPERSVHSPDAPILRWPENQATLHFPVAFWGMLLPVTVHERISDIWRSYFTQALLPLTGAVPAFAPSWVQQVRTDFMLFTFGAMSTWRENLNIYK